MTGLFPLGHVVQLPDMPGKWQVWSRSGDSPGAYFFIPYDDEAKEQGLKYVVAKAIDSRREPRPVITVLRTEAVGS